MSYEAPHIKSELSEHFRIMYINKFPGFAELYLLRWVKADFNKITNNGFKGNLFWKVMMNCNTVYFDK